MKFPKDNEIVYSQDFAFHKGVPSDINFSPKVNKDGTIVLTAPGYGKSGDYGNGSLFIRIGSYEVLLRSLKKSLGDIAYDAIMADVKSKVLSIFK